MKNTEIVCLSCLVLADTYREAEYVVDSSNNVFAVTWLRTHGTHLVQYHEFQFNKSNPQIPVVMTSRDLEFLGYRFMKPKPIKYYKFSEIIGNPGTYLLQGSTNDQIEVGKTGSLKFSNGTCSYNLNYGLSEYWFTGSYLKLQEIC
jgi:hypothetical protein